MIILNFQIRIVDCISHTFYSCLLSGFGVLNEPFADCNQQVIRKFDNLALDIVRKNMGEETNVYIGDIFDAAKFNDGFWTAENYKGTFLDSHYYHGKFFSMKYYHP